MSLNNHDISKKIIDFTFDELRDQINISGYDEVLYFKIIDYLNDNKIVYYYNIAIKDVDSVTPWNVDIIMFLKINDKIPNHTNDILNQIFNLIKTSLVSNVKINFYLNLMDKNVLNNILNFLTFDIKNTNSLFSYTLEIQDLSTELMIADKPPYLKTILTLIENNQCELYSIPEFLYNHILYNSKSIPSDSIIQKIEIQGKDLIRDYSETQFNFFMTIHSQYLKRN